MPAPPLETSAPVGTVPKLNASVRPGGSGSGGSDRVWRSRYPKETYIACLAGFGIAAHLAAKYVFHLSVRTSNATLLLVLLFGGIPLLFDLLKKVRAGEFGADLLAGFSIVTSVVLGEYLAGSIVVLMLSGGTALEQYATRRASAVLGALAKRMPQNARRLVDTEMTEITLEDVRPGDLLVVFPHEICPADGTVVEGHGSMDESYLTGEPFQISKVAGSTVLSGAVNGDTALTIRATHLPVDSRYAKIMRVMQEAERNRPQFRRIGDRLGAWYTAVALSVGFLAALIGRDPTRFLAVLVIATPCPLLLAIPVAIIGAISVAASRAIIIKNPAMLERVDGCRTVIFDKTGTLTYGKPALTDVLCAPAVTEEQAVALAASVERYSKHPLASTILEAAQQRHLDLTAVSSISEKPGQGLIGTVDKIDIEITGRKKLLQKHPNLATVLPLAAPGLECILLLNGEYAATFRFHDAPRKESLSFIRHLSPKHRVNRIVLLSGDREEEVRYLAGQVGITEVLFGQSPEEKVQVVKESSKNTPTLFVGDGINDAPAMQAATVSVAFGQNSDVVAEAADAVVLEPSLSKVDELIHIGRRMRGIALQSAIGGMGLSILGMLFAAAGFLPPVPGAIAQEVIDAAAVLNALRVAFPAAELRDDGL